MSTSALHSGGASSANVSIPQWSFVRVPATQSHTHAGAGCQAGKVRDSCLKPQIFSHQCCLNPSQVCPPAYLSYQVQTLSLPTQQPHFLSPILNFYLEQNERIWFAFVPPGQIQERHGLLNVTIYKINRSFEANERWVKKRNVGQALLQKKYSARKG